MIAHDDNVIVSVVDVLLIRIFKSPKKFSRLLKMGITDYTHISENYFRKKKSIGRIRIGNLLQNS